MTSGIPRCTRSFRLWAQLLRAIAELKTDKIIDAEVSSVCLRRTSHTVRSPNIITMPKPRVLHMGDPIKYNHEFYNTEFLDRFEVVRNDTTTRADFLDALKEKR